MKEMVITVMVYNNVFKKFFSDIDECASIFNNNRSRCPPYSKCQNLPGSFLCHCTTGFELFKKQEHFFKMGFLNECIG